MRGAKVRACHKQALTVLLQVVAGLEPEKTNQFLQHLAECASDSSLDFGQAVQMTLHGIAPSIDGIPRIEKLDFQRKVDCDSDSKNTRLSNEIPPPSSRAGVRATNGEIKHMEAPSRLGGMGFGIPGLDEQIEACDGSPTTTRMLLEPIISRPKLSDKLLGKPPFRFLHDIISEVVRKTSFASGLYNEIESDSSKVTEKNSKIEYLAKLVKLVGMQLNTIVEARLAVAASLAPDSKQAVSAVLASEEFLNGAPAVPLKAEAKENLREAHDQKQSPSEKIDRDHSKDYSSLQPPPDGDIKAGDAQAADASYQKSSGEKMNLSMAQPKRSARPTTARRRPPRYKDNATTEENNAKAGSKVQIIVDGDETDENEDDAQVGVEVRGLGSANEAIADGKSKLVREIQEEERAAAKNVLDAKEQDGGIRFGRIDHAVAGFKEKLSEANLYFVQQTVQALCRSTNPLGKCMDYVHEDVATMHKELEKWEQEYKAQLIHLERELEFTRSVTRPLEFKVKQLSEQIWDERKRAQSVKGRMLHQEEHVGQLLRMVSAIKF